MKYHTSTTQFNCGIDLHARQMYVCVMDRDGKKLVHTNVRNNDFAFFLKLVAPYRHDLTVCAECMFGWYWLADACQDAGIHFVLAHALYVKAIHGGKNKNDRIDSEKLCHLLRSNLIPPAYPQVIYVPEYAPAYVWGPPAWGYYPPLYYAGYGFGFYPGINIGLYFGGWGGWGYGGWGWGWGPNWFGGSLFVNGGFFNRYGFGGGL